REEGSMKATQRLHDAGQSIWLDNITRAMLASGTLERYVRELSVTGLTSNPTIFDHAIKNSHDYDAAIREQTAAGKAGEELFFELALADLRQAADLFRPVHEATNRVDGWVSLELSPTLAYDTPGSVAAAKALYARANRPNLFIKIPGTREGIPAIEEAIFAGVPINVTLLFSREQYLAALVGEHRDEGPEGVGRALREIARRAALGEHDAGADAARARRPRRHRPHAAARRRRRGGGARPLRARGRRRRCPGRRAPARR